MKCLFIFSLLIACGLSAVAKESAVPTKKQIRLALQGFKEEPIPFLQRERLSKLFHARPGTVVYVPITWLRASQNRVSYDRVIEKARSIFAREGVQWSEKKGVDELPYDNGRSLYPEDLAAPGELLPDGFAINDHTHESVVGILSSTKTVPILITHDLSDLATNELAWQTLKEQELAYLKNISGYETRVPVGFANLEDDPNRYLASLISRRITSLENEGELTLKFSPSAQDIWVKMDGGIPFIEFKIADILYRARIVFDPGKGITIDPKSVEKIRRVLLDAKANGARALKDIPIIPALIPAKVAEKDPNMHLARLTARVIGEVKGKPADVNDRLVSPLWLVDKKDFESKRAVFARALYRHGLIYDWNDDNYIPDELLAKLASTLRVEARQDELFHGMVLSRIPESAERCAEILSHL